MSNRPGYALVLSAGLLAVLLASADRRSFADDAAAAFPDAPGRVTPVPPEKQIDPDVRMAFRAIFGKEVDAALASDDTADDAALARRLFDEAGKDPDLAALAAVMLDHVVYLGSIRPDTRSLAYAALDTQWAKFMRPAEGCLRKMMQLAPGVVEAMEPGSRKDWIQKTWIHDADQACPAMLKARRWDAARKAAADLAEACRKYLGNVPPNVDRLVEGTTFLSDLDLVRKQCRAAVAEPGHHPREQLFLAIDDLFLHGRRDEGLAGLRAAGSSAAQRLAGLMSADPASATPASHLATAGALAELAGGTSAFCRYLLWREAGRELTAATASPDISEADRRRAAALLKQAQAETAKIIAEIPPLAREILDVGPVGPAPGEAVATAGADTGGDEDWHLFAGIGRSSSKAPPPKGSSHKPAPAPATGATTQPASEPGSQAASEPTSQPAGEPAAKTEGEPETPKGEPMPEADRKGLERMIQALNSRHVCAACNGRGKIVRKEDITIDPRHSETRVVVKTCGACGGTGKAPLSQVAHIVKAAEKVLEKYADAVPAGLRRRAQAAMAFYTNQGK